MVSWQWLAFLSPPVQKKNTDNSIKKIMPHFPVTENKHNPSLEGHCLDYQPKWKSQSILIYFQSSVNTFL